MEGEGEDGLVRLDEGWEVNEMRLWEYNNSLRGALIMCSFLSIKWIGSGSVRFIGLISKGAGRSEKMKLLGVVSVGRKR